MHLPVDQIAAGRMPYIPQRVRRDVRRAGQVVAVDDIVMNVEPCISDSISFVYQHEALSG